MAIGTPGSHFCCAKLSLDRKTVFYVCLKAMILFGVPRSARGFLWPCGRLSY